MCVYVFVNNSYLFIGLKLYTTKASLRQDVLFGCQKKLKKKKKGTSKKGGLLDVFFSFSSSSPSLFLWLMTTVNSVLETNSKKVKRKLLRSSSRRRGLHGIPENGEKPRSHHFPAESKWESDSTIPKIFMFQSMRLRPSALVLPKASMPAGTEERLVVFSSALSIRMATQPLLFYQFQFSH